MKKAAMLCIAIVLLTACSGQIALNPTHTPSSPSKDIDLAREILIAYFDDLYIGNYTDAVERYGGGLSQLSEWNPDLNSHDTTALLQAACERQLQCLPVRQITYATQTDPSTFKFILEFSNADGTLFVLGPCCGETETEVPPVSQFPCTVVKSQGGNFQVMCLPVYVP
jgi:hypothetical protein